MQYQTVFCRTLGFQCFLQRPDCKIAGDMAICYARHHAPVMKVYDGTVVANIPIFQEQICEIRTPFLIRLVRMEVLLSLILEYFMGLVWLSPRLFSADDGAQTHLRVQVFMDGRTAIAVPCTFQIGGHATVAVHSVMAVVDVADLFLNFRFFCIIIRLSVFPIVIAGIRADPQPSQEPADTEIFLMTVNKPISL